MNSWNIVSTVCKCIFCIFTVASLIFLLLLLIPLIQKTLGLVYPGVLFFTLTTAMCIVVVYRIVRSTGGNEERRLIESFVCLVAVLIVALLIILLPEYIGNRITIAEYQVFQNMLDLEQNLIEYARNHNGRFPEKIDDDLKGSFRNDEGHYITPINPFTGKPQWPQLGNVVEIANARKEKFGSVSTGATEYSPLRDTNGIVTGYAIRGGGGAFVNKALSNRYYRERIQGTSLPRHGGACEGPTLVLSNQDLPFTRPRLYKQQFP